VFTSPQRIFGAGEWSLEQVWWSSALVTMGRPSFLSSLKHSSFFFSCTVGFALQSFSFCPSLWGIFVGLFLAALDAREHPFRFGVLQFGNVRHVGFFSSDDF
jgi:hypothetical protein